MALHDRQTDEVRRNFALPDTEIVIQDYHCSIWRTAVYVQGRIWLTQNYVLFQGLGIQEVMPYRKMIEVKKERTQLFLEGLSIALGPEKTVRDAPPCPIASNPVSTGIL